MASLLTDAVNVFFRLLYYLILIRVFLSWLPGLRYSAVGRAVYNLTEPVLGPARRMLDKSPLGGGMMVDFSPVIALFMLEIVQTILLYVIGMF
ncbi:MAG: YggT family protein [Clostridia bacterium]|nr:YggT family protein [Clostridia bacterium]